jgi:GNAT superfamily N-acetyltransferase
VAFATTRLVSLQDAGFNDRQCLSKLLAGVARSTDKVMYILTLGVLAGHQRQGLATALVGQVAEVCFWSSSCSHAHVAICR